MESLVYEREIDLGYICFSIIVKVVENVLKKVKNKKERNEEKRKAKVLEFSLRILRPTKQFLGYTIRPIWRLQVTFIDV